MLSVKNKVEGVEAVTEDVVALRRRWRGNPVGIGVVGFAGWLIGI